MEKLRVTDGCGYTETYVSAEFICDLQATEPSQSTAWNGTALLYKAKDGQYYIDHHSGRSGDNSWAEHISTARAEALIKKYA